MTKKVGIDELYAIKGIANELHFELYEKLIDIFIESTRKSVTKKISRRKMFKLSLKYADTLSEDELDKISDEIVATSNKAIENLKNLI